MTIEFSVSGPPQPKGSMKAYRKARGKTILVSANPNLKQYELALRLEAMQVWRNCEQDILPPGHAVRLEVEARFERPATHFVNRKRGGRIREDAPMWHTNKPDSAKILRAVEDALTGVVYDDDRQVFEEQIKKVWHDENETIVRLTW